ncbi:hypothetical protein [Pseudomonas farris]
MPVLKARTYQSVSYVDGIAQGLSVFDLPNDQAQDDIKAITLELLEMDK